ncbi:MAG: hypothetical protein LM513_00190 [Nitrospira sp.]|nr:hypothetical protein [Nitrospira sp.]
MLQHVKPYLSPVSIVLSDIEGEHLGTGSYCSVKSARFLVTNDHVAEHQQGKQLAHQFHESDSVAKLQNPFCGLGWPTDVALSQIDDSVWNICQHSGKAIPQDSFCELHLPVERELLFLVGFSGERSRFMFGTLISPGTPYLTQECQLPTEHVDPEKHFALHYRPDLASSVEKNSFGLPDPHGFSGSLVWNTRRVECIQKNEEWSPELAKVTGIVWGWPSSDACLLATKVEHMQMSALAGKCLTIRSSGRP